MAAVPYSQGYIFFITFLGGILIGIIWDIYRILRHFTKLGKKGIVIGDILFWVLSAIIGFRIILYISWGNLRGFIFLGFFLGGAFYFYAFSRYVLKILIFIIKQMVLTIVFIWFLITYPLMLLKYKIYQIMKPYKNKVEFNIALTKRKYKFFKYKLKRVLNEKEMMYNKKKDQRTKKVKVQKKKETKKHKRKKVNKKMGNKG